jgi:outer membrane protein OmpA-like peptidoglycan-associated protein
MKKTALALALSTLTLGVAHSHETSHWKNSAGEFVKNASGECVQTINHEDADDAKCHGGTVKRQVPESTIPAKDLMAEKKKAMEEEARKRADAAKKAIESKKNEVLMSLEKISLASSASFNTGSANLSTAGKTELDSLSEKLKQVGSGLKSVTVEGHTDGSGPASFNQKLSQKRSDAVKTYLIAKGIDGAKIVSKGFGESQPIASNDTVTGRGQNRRVEIKVDGDIVESVQQ